MTLRYGSVCSGVEAASLAWEPLGFTPQWFSEIEAFPSEVLNNHWPNVQNLGDMTDERFISRAGAIDVLVGGTPCQSFSVAGFRGGLDDERGNLALEFCRIAKEKQPRWVVWENVPGCLSTNGGRDFGSIVGALAECGYNLAWRILDAQNWGVPQRRRRVFLVGHLGADERGATAVLFESNSLQGSAKTSRKKGQKTAPTVTGGPPYSRTGNERVESDAIVPIVGPVTARKGRNGGIANDDIHAGMQVRRLTPRECERLQGMPDDHTRIPWRNKSAEDCPDTPRYKAIGNSMAVPVMRWIGERILIVDKILGEQP